MSLGTNWDADSCRDAKTRKKKILASSPPLDFRMLDIEQVVIFLQPTSSEIVFRQQYTDRKTRHEYRVIRLWEEDPAPLLKNPALLPLATLTRSNSPNALLQQVATSVDMIEETDERPDRSLKSGNPPTRLSSKYISLRSGFSWFAV